MRSGQRQGNEPLTSLIFPTFNPGPRLERTWKEVERFLWQTAGSWEILFVCDGCTDGTAERLAELTHGCSNLVRTLSYTPNRGKGYAVRRGLRAARGAWRIFTDVDLAYGFADVLRLAQALWDGAEMAAASRTHPDSRVVVPRHLQGYALRRHLQSRVFGFLTRQLLPLTQHDTQAGLKGMTARMARLLLPHLSCDGFGFDCELLTACARFRVPVAEIPVCVRLEDRTSTTGLRCVGQMVGQLWRIRRAWHHTRPIPMSDNEIGQRQVACAGICQFSTVRGQPTGDSRDRLDGSSRTRWPIQVSP
jgi:hypothetical protein